MLVGHLDRGMNMKKVSNVTGVAAIPSPGFPRRHRRVIAPAITGQARASPLS